MNNIAVSTQNLTKYIPASGTILGKLRKNGQKEGMTTVKNFNLTVQKGELFGLLGPNGAGKTTLAKMLCTLTLPTSGSAMVAGHNLLTDGQKIRRKVGLVVADERSFYWRLSLRQNLLFFANLYDIRGDDATKRVDAVLDSVQLLDRAESQFHHLSTGMKQRMAIARGILHKPEILFLDEPSRSLDPNATNRLHELIRSLHDQWNLTMFLITHDMKEAEQLCHRVAIMNEGNLLATGNASELRRQLQPYRTYHIALDREPAAEVISTLQTISPLVAYKEDRLTLRLIENETPLQEVLSLLSSHHLYVQTIDNEIPTLEQLFIQLTNSEE